VRAEAIKLDGDTRPDLPSDGQRPEVGKTENPACVCDGWTPQNAAHLFRCPWVGDGMSVLAHEDEEWCAAVARFIYLLIDGVDLVKGGLMSFFWYGR